MMHIGVPTETKIYEYRVGLTPAAVRELTETGHTAGVQSGAGLGIGFDDDAYQRAGAEILADAEAVLGAAELIVKVKEPSAAECDLLRREHTLFSYLHLAADAKLTARDGSLPLLAATNHADPTFVEEGIVHYCVTNMPGAVADAMDKAESHAEASRA